MGSIEYYILNLELYEDFTINLEGYTFEVCKLENYDEIMNKLKDDKDLHQIGYTAKIRITHDDDLNKEETAKITEIIDIICELLSYATGNGVISSYYVIKNGNNTVEKTIRSCFTKRYVKDAQVIDNKDLKGFLKSTYDNYKKWRDIFGLNILFEIMNYSKSFNIMQFDILILCVALEYLSNKTLQYYESKGENIDSSLLKNKQKKLEKILKNNGISDEITGKIIEECKTKRILYTHPSLKDCIVKLKKEFDISYKGDTKPKYPTTENVSKKDKKDIYQIRNDIVHRLHIDSNIYWNVCFDIHLLINIIILRILEYSGKFYPCRCLKNESCDMCEFIKNS